MTAWLDAPIAVPANPADEGVLNPAIEYLALCAWGDVFPHARKFGAAAVSAIYRQAGRQVPRPVQRIKGERIGPIVRRGIGRIQRHAPAVQLTLGRLVAAGMDVPALPPGGLGARPAARVPMRVSEIEPDVWCAARPALAMLAALPVDWESVRTDVAPLEALLYRPAWVADAIRCALTLAVQIEAVLGPPALLAPRPRLYRARPHLIHVRPAALARLLEPPAANRRGADVL
jgi:hypothetical protein